MERLVPKTLVPFCDRRKTFGALAPVARRGLAGLFSEDEAIRVQCPRCAATHLVTRVAMEAFLAGPAP